jgi:transcriptional regulator with XRE-family HTH domain
MRPMAWIPDGRRLRQVREQQEYSIEQLAEAAGVGEKTIRNLESGRTRGARLPTLKALCAVLDIEVTDIARPEEAPGPRGPAQQIADGLPPPSRLEQLVEQELGREPGRPPPAALPTAEGPVQMLTPKRFQDVMTAFQLHEGRRLWLPALVLRQRGISEAEAQALGTECGIGARFLLGQRPELGGGEPFHVTAFTRQSAHTGLLQDRLESRAELPLLLRVAVARPGRSESAGAEGRRGFSGFAFFGSQTLHPWALVVDAVLNGRDGSDSGDPGDR